MASIPDASKPLSAVLITKNAGAHLSACLTSLAFCDEIVIVDSGSTDNTEAIATQFGARFIFQEWLGFGPQKQFAVNQARHDWVLCLDADESVSPHLAASIQVALTRSDYAVYRMPRCNRFMGRWLKHGEGYPDYNIRLFDRRQAQWSAHTVHEHVVTRQPVGTLSGDLMHDSADDIAVYLDKQNRYTTLQAAALVAQGKVPTVSKMLFSPLLRAFKMLVLKGGWKDGAAGLVHISIGCFNSFIKYAKARELARQKQEHNS